MADEEKLEITEKTIGDINKFYAKGRIDSNSAGTLQETLDKAIEEGKKNIILNMLQVEYLSSIGIRAMLKTYKQAENLGGSFKIESPSEIVKNVLGMVALNQLLIA